MRKQNNYNFCKVIFTLLLLMQAISANAGEVTNKSMDAPESTAASSAKENQSKSVNPSDVEVKPLESQTEVTGSEKKKNNKAIRRAKKNQMKMKKLMRTVLIRRQI
jgi:hypothetical protein